MFVLLQRRQIKVDPCCTLLLRLPLSSLGLLPRIQFLLFSHLMATNYVIPMHNCRSYIILALFSEMYWCLECIGNVHCSCTREMHKLLSPTIFNVNVLEKCKLLSMRIFSSTVCFSDMWVKYLGQIDWVSPNISIVKIKVHVPDFHVIPHRYWAIVSCFYQHEFGASDYRYLKCTF